MEAKEINRMRLKQVAVTNIIAVTAFIIFFIIIIFFEIISIYFHLALGVLLLFRGIFGFMRKDSTKSIIPIFEKVAIYEKKKMGREWYKQRKAGNFAGLVLSFLFFLQAYLYRNFPDIVIAFNGDFLFVFIMLLISLVVINIGMIIHFRKVDHSTSQLDLKGYTWKSNLIGIVLGFLFCFVMFAFIIIYVLSRFYL